MVEKLGRRMTAAEEARFWHELNEQERLKKEDRHRSARPAFTPTPAPFTPLVRTPLPRLLTRRSFIREGTSKALLQVAQTI